MVSDLYLPPYHSFFNPYDPCYPNNNNFININDTYLNNINYDNNNNNININFLGPPRPPTPQLFSAQPNQSVIEQFFGYI